MCVCLYGWCARVYVSRKSVLYTKCNLIDLILFHVWILGDHNTKPPYMLFSPTNTARAYIFTKFNISYIQNYISKIKLTYTHIHTMETFLYMHI